MKQIILLITIIFSSSNFLFAQPFTNVMISNQLAPEEPSICINPKNLNQVVAGANLNSFYYSTNGGYNWTRGTLTNSSYGVWGDPCIAVDTNGIFYYFHLSNPSLPAPAHWIDRIVCQKSTNGGISWNNPGSFTYFHPTKDQDKEWVAIDWTHGPRGNWIYCTWTQFDNYGTTNQLDSSNILFSRSSTSGETWDTANVKRINQIGGDCWDGDNTVEGAVPAVGPNGEIYVAWAGPLVRNSQYRIFFDKSTDGGNTWLANDIQVANNPGGWDISIAGIQRANGMPVTCSDISGSPYNGYIYINWLDSVSPGDHDVKFSRSTNGGLNWSTPIRVNDDPAGKEQFFPWMAVDQTNGHIYIIFYDRRNYSDNQTDVYLARSTNGGASFTNVKISETPFLPTSGTFFGDYNNITASNGKVRPIWTRLHSGSLSVWTAIIDYPVAVPNQNNEIPKNFSLAQNFPNPFNPSTSIKFSVPGNTNFITLKVYNVLGKEVSTLVNETLNAGEYEIEWNASNQPSGVYFYKLISGDGSFSETKKMILVK